MTDGPILKSERLELRPIEQRDFEGLVRLIEADSTRRYLGNVPVSRAREFERMLRNAGSWRLYGYGGFAVRLLGKDELVATCSIFRSWREHGDFIQDMPEAGWIVREDYLGQGIAGEAMAMVLDWFDEAFPETRIACMIEAGNLPSEKLASRLGFTEFGRHPLEGPEGTDAEMVFYERKGAADP